MQKSKVATIIIIALIFLYSILATFKLIPDINILYLYVINPLFWIFTSVLLRVTLGSNSENKKLKKPIIEYTIIAVLSFIIVYMLSGLVVTFGKNPYNTSLKGLMNNIWLLGVALIGKEYVRYKLINNVYDKDKSKIAILISICYVFMELEVNRVIGTTTPLTITKHFMQTGLPAIAENIVFSYTAIYCGCLPAIIYRGITNLYFWISPILPNMPWVMKAIIDTIIPAILFLYIRYIKNKLDIFRNRQNILDSDPRSIIPLIVLIILAIWFAVGIFPIKPVAVATGSMEKELNVGDIVIIKKCNANDINVGDIIEYKMEGYTVIHRVIEKKQTKGEYSFITKGDNNGNPDKEPVKEDQLIGKVIFKIRYLGYPAIWLNIIKVNDQMIEVETGG